MKKRIFLFACPFLYFTATFCQDSPAENNSVITTKSYFKSSLSYLSNAVYQGRKDSSVISYITPSISYINKSGFNITGAISYSPNPGLNQVELITVETCYDHQFSESFSATGYAAAYFYNQFSTSVQSENNGSLGIGINYSPTDIFTLSADAGVSVSKKPDIATELSLGHSFYFGSEGDEWSLAPAVAVVAGSQGYYQSYYTNRKFNQNIRARQVRRRRGNSGGTNTSAGTVSVVSGKGFKILDYELSAPMTYDKKRYGFFFTPTYAIPIHPLSYTTEGSSTPTVENLTNSFYVLVGAYVKF